MPTRRHGTEDEAMADAHNDAGLLGWALGAVATAVAAAFSWIWNRMQSIESRLDARVTVAEAAAKTTASAADVRDLWAAITEDRKAGSAFREKILEHIGHLPTKEDLTATEARLIATLDRQNHR
jgi:hypothetical protein